MDRKAGGAGGKGSAINDENKQSSQTASNRKRQDKRSDAKKEDNSQSAQPKGAPQATAEQMRMAQVGCEKICEKIEHSYCKLAC